MFTPPAQTKRSVCSTGILSLSCAPSATFGCVFGSPEVNCTLFVPIVLLFMKMLAIGRRCFIFVGELGGELGVLPDGLDGLDGQRMIRWGGEEFDGVSYLCRSNRRDGGVYTSHQNLNNGAIDAPYVVTGLR